MNQLNQKLVSKFILILVLLSTGLYAQGIFKVDLDTVAARKFDTGKMWTFDFPPTNYFESTYNFRPGEDWYEDVRLSALRIPGCTASFISEDGLVMTNHHCVDGLRRQIQNEGEDLSKTYFYATTLEEERKIPNYYADQLVLIEDVTDIIWEAYEQGQTDEEKTTNVDAKIKELQEQYSEETGLFCQVVTFYNGGKYSLYGYKRYQDVRMVFIPDFEIGSYGGDPDNFTYPRYDLDFSFMRVYDENGNPVKAKNYFEWSQVDPTKDDVLFTIGNPGSTNRLKTVAQLEFLRDYYYKNLAYLFDGQFNGYEKLKSFYPERTEEFEAFRRRIGNGWKSITNTYKSLNDDYLFARKKAFEKMLIQKVNSDTELREKYGHVWKTIEQVTNEKGKLAPEFFALSIFGRFESQYFTIANAILELAEQLQKPEEERDPAYKAEELEQTIENLFPAQFDKPVQDMKLKIRLDMIQMNLGDNHELVRKMFKGKKGNDAYKSVLENSIVVDRDKVFKLKNMSAKEILELDDPLLHFTKYANENLEKISEDLQELNNTESAIENLLGQVQYKVFGTSIPPDATFTLRIGDGVMKHYEYNGTVAPTKTTFYGMYDRYYGFDKEYPWDLPQLWKNPNSGLDLSTTFNFISTNDLVGGSSGSAVINKNREVVGVAFDGNIESLSGDFIYMTNTNRAVIVSSVGIIKALEYIYKADRIVSELKTGKIK
ncbi:MAG: S46 family peptidase [Ignavibacteriales bacterium]|nr:S46 family peptidase [Ignavibacteriales bacterium]